MRNVEIYTILSILMLFSSQIVIASSESESESVEVTEYAHEPVAYGRQNYQRYLNQQGVPRLQLVHRSSENNKTHWVEVIDGNGRVLKSFGDNYSVSTQAEGRYRDKAMLYVTARRQKCKKNCNRYYLFSSDKRVINMAPISLDEVFDTLILKNGNFISLNSTGLKIVDNKGRTAKTIPAPFVMTDGAFGSDIDGKWLAIAVSEDGAIWFSDENGWNDAKLMLSGHGDRNGVLSIFPQDQSKVLIAVYRYINEYNKGLYLMDYDMEANKIEQQGWLFNSENRNIGFDPDVYFNTAIDKVVVSATNSSGLNGQGKVYFTLTSESMAALRPELPQHVQESGFASEKMGSFMIGGGISQVGWVAKSKIEKNDFTYGEVNYLIADTLFISANIEARLGNTSLTINYLQNQAEDLAESEIDSATTNTGARTLAKEASSYLFSTIDFHGLISASSSLRLVLEKGETKGVAEVDMVGKTIEYSSFATEYNRIGLLAMQERGFYMGGDYVDYSMPSAVGFSNNNGSIVYTGFDPDFKFSSLRFVTGYDALAYAKRYETDYSRWYWAGGVNIGMGWATLSDEIINDAKQVTGKSKVADLPLFFVVGGELEFGYVWQKRSKSLGGMGYSSALGYKVNGNFLGAGQGEDSSNDDTESLALEFSRMDVFHGPFFKANILF